jgi:hypothetical protein
MKSGLKKFIVLFFVLVAASLLNKANAAVALTVTPSVVSNTYIGVITLQITNGEQVRIEKYIDLNGNGSIDAGEPLVDDGKVTDNNNSSAIIDGITNINVPIDNNSATGAITTSFIFSPILTLENMVGQYVFQVVSSEGQATATFAVTNAALSQSVGGIIYSNDGVTPLPHAVVVAQDLQADNPVGAAMADATGHYFLTLKPGNYAVLAGFPNYYFDQNLAPVFTLTNGMSVTNNLTLTNGTVTISGNVYNSANSNGVGGVLLQVQSGSLFAFAFTDTNGNYSAAVTPNFWQIKPDKVRLSRHAFVISQNTFQVDTTGGNVTNANIALFKANALFYGRITDNNGVPFDGIAVDGGGDMNNPFDSKSFTDTNGDYTVAVLGGTNNWSPNPFDSGNVALDNYIVNSFDYTNIAVGQAIQENYVALPVTGHISGHLLDNTGNPVVGVDLFATANIGGLSYSSLNAVTDGSGNYSLGVASGSWGVGFGEGGESGLDTAGFVDWNGPYNVSIPPTNVVLNLTVYPIGTPLIVSPHRFGSSQFGFTINGATNVSYTVQVSTNLASTNWANLFSLTLTNNTFPVVDVNATNSARFYRILKN